jgi:uncharacterized protein YjbJ (UPF0337 family)
MTQTFNSGMSSSSMSSNDRNDENQSSTEIRADIDQTRASVGDKIDQLQARLDPNRLKAQAQETVQEMVSDTANSVTEYVRTHKDEMVNSLADAARRNPLPTALVGLGIGWLLLESISSGRSDDRDRYEYDRRNFRTYGDRNRFDGSTGRSFVSQGRGQYMEEDYYSPEYYEVPDYGRSGYPAPGAMPSGYRGEYQGRSEYSQEYDREYGKRYGNGHHRNPVAKATDAVKDTMSNVSSEIKDRLENLGSDIKDRVEDAGQGVKDRVSDMRHGMQDQMGEMSHGMQDRMDSKMDEMRYQQWQMRHSMERSMENAGERMSEWQRRARYEGRRRGRQMMRNLEDNPLTYGAIALAAGAALAFLLPQTRTENRYFGEMRDEIMDRGEEVFDSAKMRAQQVASEMRPELEQKVRQVASEATEMGKEIVKDAANELRPVVDKAMEKGKQEARAVAQEAGVDPDKVMDKMSGNNSSTLNRDTMSGQWKQIRGDVKSKWGKLTDDDMTRIEGDYEKLVGAIQTRYGHERAQIEREINDFFNSRNTQGAAQASTQSSKA